MEEQLISFGIAKILKEKNIVIESFYHYDTDGYLMENSVSNKSHVATHHLFGNNTDFELDRWGGGNISSIAAPTQSLLQKWLRETKKIIISVVFELNSYELFIDNGYNTGSEGYGDTFDTYEEALETGLQEALKLI